MGSYLSVINVFIWVWAVPEMEFGKKSPNIFFHQRVAINFLLQHFETIMIMAQLRKFMRKYKTAQSEIQTQK